ncbi:branched-chain amino acid ABC transporter permease [Aquabacter sp. L1I39]|uniref:branched-chain amino acid ABC transporter permease n=1 Tax=Aquabacter sp. L1I39 TaxID=2820278 RepID=UPI001AD95A08|nr:branched-chain amino acid ABC transporter permease [Aquabacter sp. L1I39]QTL05548.1 branched-chain amino acid ABC transporter permease [Aquabacter sp. L1I39]
MLAQQIVNGLMLGAIYMLVAVAFTLAIGVLNFLNFSLPGLFMLGGMLAFGMMKIGWPWFLAFAAALFVAAVVSLLVERLAYRPMQGGDPEVPLVSSLGFLVLLENLMLIQYGSDQQAFPSLLPDLNLRMGGLVIGIAQLISLAISVALVAWLSWFLRSTNMGRRIRTVAESRDTALLMGINISRLVPQLFVASALLTALAGILFAVNYQQVSPFMGEGVGFKGVAAMIVGGMGSIWGAVLGGLLIGLAEVLSISFIGADVVNITVYGLLLLILILRPQGLLGRPASREKL